MLLNDGVVLLVSFRAFLRCGRCASVPITSANDISFLLLPFSTTCRVNVCITMFVFLSLPSPVISLTLGWTVLLENKERNHEIGSRSFETTSTRYNTTTPSVLQRRNGISYVLSSEISHGTRTGKFPTRHNFWPLVFWCPLETIYYSYNPRVLALQYLSLSTPLCQLRQALYD